MVVNLEHLKSQLARLKSTVGDTLYDNERRDGSFEVLVKLCEVVDDLEKRVTELEARAPRTGLGNVP